MIKISAKTKVKDIIKSDPLLTDLVKGMSSTKKEYTSSQIEKYLRNKLPPDEVSDVAKYIAGRRSASDLREASTRLKIPKGALTVREGPEVVIDKTPKQKRLEDRDKKLYRRRSNALSIAYDAYGDRKRLVDPAKEFFGENRINIGHRVTDENRGKIVNLYKDSPVKLTLKDIRKDKGIQKRLRSKTGASPADTAQATYRINKSLKRIKKYST